MVTVGDSKVTKCFFLVATAAMSRSRMQTWAAKFLGKMDSQLKSKSHLKIGCLEDFKVTNLEIFFFNYLVDLKYVGTTV